MVNTKLLKAEMILQDKSASQVASEIGMTRRVWYSRLQTGAFTADEMYALIKCLKISNPTAIFFAEPVTSELTTGE